jgi:chromosome segregation ATPase
MQMFSYVQDQLTSERSELVLNLESSDEALELTQEKLTKHEKETKKLTDERNTFSIQLKGAQRELQQMQMEVTDIRNKELWVAMEGDLQVNK